VYENHIWIVRTPRRRCPDIGRPGPLGDGRQSLWSHPSETAKGIYGRIDNTFQIRGENVYPSAIAEVLEAFAGYGGEHRNIISRGGPMDELAVQAEFNEKTTNKGPDAVKALEERVEAELSRVLGVRARVDMVEPDTFPRTDFKAQRVVDDRDLYQSLNQKQGG